MLLMVLYILWLWLVLRLRSVVLVVTLHPFIRRVVGKITV